MTKGNLNSGLPRRKRSGNTMQDYDALPSDLRRWLSGACLPWSPSSALRVWSNAGGARSPNRAIARLEAVEKATLSKDTEIWQTGP